MIDVQRHMGFIRPLQERRRRGPILLSLMALLLVGCGYTPQGQLPPVEGVEVDLGETNFEKEVLQSPAPVLVEFGATWCGPCQEMEPVLAHLSLNYKDRLKVGKIDVDESDQLAAEYDASLIPLMVLFKDGVEVDRVLGQHSLEELSTWVDGYL